MELANKLFKGDRVIWIIFMLLCLISVVEVFSATSTIAYKNANHWGPIARHATFLLGGFALVLILHNIPCRFFSGFIILLPVSILMLIVTPFIGIEANDAHRWLEFFGMQFQPSEFAKLACIVYTSFLLSRRGSISDRHMFRYILIGVGLTCALILPENFSTGFMLFGVCFLMMFIGQISLIRLGKLAGFLLLMGGIVLGLLKTLDEATIEKYFPDRVSPFVKSCIAAVVYKISLSEILLHGAPPTSKVCVVSIGQTANSFFCSVVVLHRALASVSVSAGSLNLKDPVM